MATHPVPPYRLQGRAKVADFGISRYKDPYKSFISMTQAGGTPQVGGWWWGGVWEGLWHQPVQGAVQVLHQHDSGGWDTTGGWVGGGGGEPAGQGGEGWSGTTGWRAGGGWWGGVVALQGGGQGWAGGGAWWPTGLPLTWWHCSLPLTSSFILAL